MNISHCTMHNAHFTMYNANNTFQAENCAPDIVSLYHGLAIYTEVTFVNVNLVEAVSSGGGPAVV